MSDKAMVNKTKSKKSLVVKKIDEKKRKMKQQTGYKLIDINKITAPAVAVRFEVSKESVTELANSIKKIGLIEPVIVRAAGAKYEVIAGHRRLMACRAAGLKKVKTIIVDVSNDDREIIKMHENTQRLNISPVEQAVYFSYLIQKKKMKQSEIAEMMNVSEGFVSQRLAVMSWHEQLIGALENEQISFSAARELARITESAALLVHLQQAVEHGVTPRVANMWWQDWIKSKHVDIDGTENREHSNDTPPGSNTSFSCGLCSSVFEYSDMVYLRLCRECYKELQEAHRNLNIRSGSREGKK